MDKITFEVKGMSCKHCAMAVERALKELDGVTEASVDLAKANVTVIYNADFVDAEKLKEKVKEVGYEPV